MCDRLDRGRLLELMRELALPTCNTIRAFDDIPHIQTLDIPPLEYIVPALGIARNTITLWTGPDGHGKTILAQSMGVAVAHGGRFLRMQCQQCPVLYLDLENPAYVVQERLRSMLAEQTAPHLRVWGTWNQQQPPQSGSGTLLRIARETRPLIIIDPFRYFHGADENESTAMSGVMKYLRDCATHGGAVVILHHPAKAEGSTGRGSSVIRAACDLAFLHKLDKENNLITLKVDKNRHGERREFAIRADFEEGKFELREGAWVQRRNAELQILQELIRQTPGISSTQLCVAIRARKSRILKILDEGCGTLWTRKEGQRGSKIFFPIEGAGSRFPSEEGEPGNNSGPAQKVSGTGGNRSEPGTSVIATANRPDSSSMGGQGVVSSDWRK